jgi:ferredoxin
METTIYYFTGTGNSLAVARDLCERLGDCRTVPIASLREEPGPIRPAANRVGIVYPVYFSGIPSIVAEIAARLDLGEVRYVFAVCTFGGSGATPSLRQLDRVLRAGAGGRGLDAGFAVRMPGNYIVLYDREADGALERTLADASRKVAAIAEAVSRGEHTMPRFSPVGAVINRAYYPRFLAGVHGADAKFTVDDRCTACGTCVAVCPVGNVRLEAGRPAWLHRCEQCMACIQYCPVEAIQAGPKTASRRRYRHPGVTVKALADQDGE